MPSKRRERELLGRMWGRVRPLLPPRPPQPKGGRPFADDKACFAGVVYQLRNATRRNDMPESLPSGVTCWRRHRERTAAGVRPRVWRRVPAESAATGLLDTTELLPGDTFAESRKGGKARDGRAAASA